MHSLGVYYAKGSGMMVIGALTCIWYVMKFPGGVTGLNWRFVTSQSDTRAANG